MATLLLPNLILMYYSKMCFSKYILFIIQLILIQKHKINENTQNKEY